MSELIVICPKWHNLSIFYQFCIFCHLSRVDLDMILSIQTLFPCSAIWWPFATTNLLLLVAAKTTLLCVYTTPVLFLDFLRIEVELSDREPIILHSSSPVCTYFLFLPILHQQFGTEEATSIVFSSLKSGTQLLCFVFCVCGFFLPLLMSNWGGFWAKSAENLLFASPTAYTSRFSPGFPLLNWVYSIDPYKMVDNSPAVLNFNRLFLKLVTDCRFSLIIAPDLLQRPANFQANCTSQPFL